MNITWWQLTLWIFCITVGGMVAHYNHFSKKYGPEAYLWLHHSRKPTSYRGYITYNIKRDSRRQIEAKLEVVWNWKIGGNHHTGASIHFGGRGSDTPIDIFLGLYFISFFFGMDFPGLGRICEWLGRGHHRNISLKVHGGSLWWELWYDDQSGYDDWHKCDKWRRIWWWPFKSDKYRSWACLRQGCIDLNPLDVMFGDRRVQRVILGEAVTTIYMINGEKELLDLPWEEYKEYFAKGRVESYELEMVLHHATASRLRGPRWTNGFQDQGYSVEWRCKEGIPFRNDSWKGDKTVSAWVRIGNTLPPGDTWPLLARAEVRRDINRRRKHYHYKAPWQVKEAITAMTPVFQEVQKAYAQIGDAAQAAFKEMQKMTDQINNPNEPRDLP